MSFLNKVSLATIAMALVNILIVVIANTYYVSSVSSIFAWSVVVTTQLSLIAVRLKNEPK